VPSPGPEATFVYVELAKLPAENLSEEEVTRRLRFGIVMLMIALMLVAVLEKTGASPYMRLTLFVPFFFAENAFFQAVHKTCGFSAMRGFRHTTDGDERIANPAELDACRCRGKTQIFHTFCAAAALTALFVWVG